MHDVFRQLHAVQRDMEQIYVWDFGLPHAHGM